MKTITSKEEEKQSISIECKIHAFDAFRDISSLLSSLRRRYFVDRYFHGIDINTLKSSYIADYNISGRHFNAKSIEVDGIVDAYKENLENNIKTIEEKIDKLLVKIEKTKKKITKHYAKRKLVRLTHKLIRLNQDRDQNIVRICFGTKDLFNKQHHLEANGFESHEEWKELWEEIRNSGFFLVGSSDESAGNQLCQINKDLAELSMRVPDALVDKYGYYITIPVDFKYEKKQLEAARSAKRAISYRFKRRDNGKLYAIATVDRLDIKVTTSRLAGAIGVDYNPDHIAGYEIDRFGNPLGKPIYRECETLGKSSDQTLAILGDLVKELVRFAKRAGKPLVIEELDFWKKKQTLKERGNKKFARMLTCFAYRKFSEMLHSKAQKEGVEVIEVKACFTSIIGKANWSKELGSSVHAVSGIAIARRGLKFSERPKLHVTSHGPVRNRGQHVWSWWRRYLSKQARSFAKAKRSRTPKQQVLNKAPPSGIFLEDDLSKDSRALARELCAKTASRQERCSLDAQNQTISFDIV